jgi:hypothetical protein
MKTLLIVLAATAARFLVACGGATPTCEACLAQQGQGVDPEGCYPYCETPPDTDGDGVEDAEDECPDTPESVNGYQDGDGCPDAPPIDPRMAGDWPGTLTSGAMGGLEAATTVTITVTGSEASVTGFCPDGSGAPGMIISGSHDTLHWSGVLGCGPARFLGCSSADLTWTAATISSTVGLVLSATLEGTATGCGRTESVIATFRSSR